MEKLKGKGIYDNKRPAQEVNKQVQGKSVPESKPPSERKIVLGSKYGSPSQK